MAHFRSVLIILAIVGLAFSNSLSNGFVGDDDVVIYNNFFYKDLSNVSRLFDKSYITYPDQVLKVGAHDYGSGSVAYRPVLSATYFLDYYLYQLKPMGYHVSNLLIHFMSCLLVYGLVFVVFGNVSLSILSALIFGVHPLKVEAVCSIGYRADLLATLFILGSVLAYIRFRKINQIKWLIVSYCSFFLALFSKESAVSFFVVYVLYDFFIENKTLKEIFTKESICHFGFAAILFFYLFVYIWIFPNASIKGLPLMGLSLKHHIESIFVIFGQYISSFAVPAVVKTLPPQYRPYIDETWGFQIVASGLIFILVVALTIYLVRKKHKLAFFMVWFWLAFVPISNIVPIANPMQFRFMYLPTVGLAICLGFFFTEVLSTLQVFNRNLKLIRIIVFSFLTMCVVTTYMLNVRWKNNATMSLAMLGDYPDDPAGYLFSAPFLISAQKHDQACQILEHGLTLGLGDFRTYYYLGVACHSNLKLSEGYFREGLVRYPQYGLMHIGLGRNLLFQNKVSEAQFTLEQAVSIMPAYTAYGYLLQTYLLLGQTQKADEVYLQASKVLTVPLQISNLKRLLTETKQKLPIDFGI